MLTPSATDPNRSAETKRRDARPTEFGVELVTPRPKDWKEVPLKSAVQSPAK